MRRLLISTIALIALSCLGCSGDEGTPGEPAPTPFEIEVEASPTLAKPGSEVTISAAVGEGATDGELTITWSREGAEDTSGDEYTFTASEPGQIVVEMTARDEAGNTSQDSVLVTIVDEDSSDVVLGDVDGDGTLGEADVMLLENVLYGTATLDEAAYERADVWPDLSVDEDDLELVRQGATEGQIATSVPRRGSIGARVTIVHQALVTVDGPVTVKFGDAPEQSAFRSRPGYLVAMVPAELTEARNLELTLLSNDQVVATLPFEILDAPQPSADPGAKVFDAVDRLENNLEHLPGLATELLDEAGASDEERRFVNDMLVAANDELGREYPKLVDALESLPAEHRAAYEQAALSNGLEQALADLDDIESTIEALEEQRSALSPEASQRIIDLICAAQKVAEVSRVIAEINQAAAYYLDKFSVAEWIPVVGQAVKVLRTVSAIIATVTDIIQIVAGFIPDISEKIIIEAERTTMVIGEQTGLSSSLTMKLTDVCKRNADTHVIGPMVEYFENLLAKRVASLVPSADSAAKALGYDPIGALAAKAVDASGFEGFMKGIADTICTWIVDDPNLELVPEWSATCGAVEQQTWTCTEECAEELLATVTAEKQICAAPKRRGDVELNCFACLEGNNCDQTCCGDSCVDTQTDSANCGSCDFVCPTASTCQSGTCECDDSDLDICDGACVDTDTSIDHCGGCGMPCDIPGAITDCQSGICEMIGCRAGVGDCDEDPANGCETDTDSNDLHCGLCGIECPMGSGCQNGTCKSSDATIASGARHSCYADGGELWCWGDNGYGQVNPNVSDGMPIPTPQKVPGYSTVASVDLMTTFSCVLLEDGTVSCFGGGDADPAITYQVGNLTGAVAMETGKGDFGCARDQMGRLLCWGDTSSLTGVFPPPSFTDAQEFTGWGDIVDFCVGHYAACAVDSNGDVRCQGELWGARYEDPQTGMPMDCQNFCEFTTPARVLDLPPVVDVECGFEYFCGRTATGEAHCWGATINGRLGDGSYICGTSLEYSSAPRQVMGLTGATEIELGSTSACAILSNGEVSCWGANYAGQLGTGEQNVSCYPAPGASVSNLTAVASVEIGGSHACALTQVGDVYCWGSNSKGQIGDGSTAQTRLYAPSQTSLP